MKERVAEQLKRAKFTEKKKELTSIQSEISTVAGKARESVQEGELDFLMQHFPIIQQRLEQLQEKLSKTPLNVPDRPQCVTTKVLGVYKPVGEITGLQQRDNWIAGSLWCSQKNILATEINTNGILKISINTNVVSILQNLSDSKTGAITTDPQSGVIFVTTLDKHEVHKFTETEILSKQLVVLEVNLDSSSFQMASELVDKVSFTFAIVITTEFKSLIWISTSNVCLELIVLC